MKHSKFYKDDFLNTQEFKKYHDLLSILLLENHLYSKKDIQKLIQDYLEKEVF